MTSAVSALSRAARWSFATPARKSIKRSGRSSASENRNRRPTVQRPCRRVERGPSRQEKADPAGHRAQIAGQRRHRDPDHNAGSLAGTFHGNRSRRRQSALTSISRRSARTDIAAYFLAPVRRCRPLEFGVWDFLAIWDLEFGESIELAVRGSKISRARSRFVATIP